MSYNDIPERPLDPPEDTRRVFDCCAICGDEIREHDEAWDLPLLGYCCAKCIKNAHIWEVEVDD